MSPSHPKPPPDHYYHAPLRPPHRPDHDDQNYVVLPSYHPPYPSKKRTTSFLLLALFVCLLVYLLWPSDPALKIVRLRLNKFRVHPFPLTVDFAVNLTLKVRNVDVYSLDLTSLDVDVGYRGKRIGHVDSGEGHVKAMGSSYIDAEVEIGGPEVVSELVYLVEDLRRGEVVFDTVAEVTGKLGLLFFAFPLKTKMSCEILVNTKNHTIGHRNCHPER